MKNYADRLHQRMTQLRTPALVGLDPRWELLPDEIRNSADAGGGDACSRRAAGFEQFCREIIEIVAPLVPAVKPQVAFFEQLGPPGMSALQSVIRHARDAGLMVIADGKRGDIGSTAEAYAAAWLAGEDPDAAPFSADALTVNAYLGDDTLQPFVRMAVERGAGLYVLVRTSNPGATAFQDIQQDRRKVFECVADAVEQLNAANWPGEDYGGVGAVVGATWPQELQSLRARMPATPLLIPGYGSQGGTAEDVLSGLDSNGLGALINSSRGINFAHRSPLYADTFGEANWRGAIEAATKKMVADLRPADGQDRMD